MAKQKKKKQKLGELERFDAGVKQAQEQIKRDGIVTVNEVGLQAVNNAFERLNAQVAQMKAAAEDVISNADDTGCTEDLTVTSKAAIERLEQVIGRLKPKATVPQIESRKQNLRDAETLLLDIRTRPLPDLTKIWANLTDAEVNEEVSHIARVHEWLNLS
jgi:hypothetical protein